MHMRICHVRTHAQQSWPEYYYYEYERPEGTEPKALPTAGARARARSGGRAGGRAYVRASLAYICTHMMHVVLLLQLIHWIREPAPGSEQAATEARSVLLWERELVRMLELSDRCGSAVASITSALSDSQQGRAAVV